MSDEIHHGGCLCGATRYETHGKPLKTAVCHCRYCQLMTGSAFGVSTYFPATAVTFTGAPLRSYSFETESGRTFTTRFCDTCGTRVSWSVEALPDLVGIAAGTFDPPSFWFDVSREIFTRSKAPFVSLDLSEHFETTASYAPCRAEPPHRQGA